MQFWADIIKSMNIKGYLTIDDLYNLSEKEVIQKILNCEDKYLTECFTKFQNSVNVYKSNVQIENKYCIEGKTKKRYVIPLAKYNDRICRINEISEVAKKDIDVYFRIKPFKYTGFDFDFKPYKID